MRLETIIVIMGLAQQQVAAARATGIKYLKNNWLS